MKQLMQLAIGMAVLTSSSAMAADYGMAGCGLGSLVFQNKNAQVSAATTNGTFYSQTFGITSGTSNCVTDGVVNVDKEQEMFMEANFEAMQRDIAAGGGEHLAAFGTLLGCQDDIRSELYGVVQSSYSTAFPNADTTSRQALYLLKLQLSNVHDIKAACSRI